jgi:hypothetical protein
VLESSYDGDDILTVRSSKYLIYLIAGWRRGLLQWTTPKCLAQICRVRVLVNAAKQGLQRSQRTGQSRITIHARALPDCLLYHFARMDRVGAVGGIEGFGYRSSVLYKDTGRS